MAPWSGTRARESVAAAGPHNQQGAPSPWYYNIFLRTTRRDLMCGHIIQGYRFPSEQRSQAGSSPGSTAVGDHAGRPGAAHLFVFVTCNLVVLFVCLLFVCLLPSFPNPSRPSSVFGSPVLLGHLDGSAPIHFATALTCTSSTADHRASTPARSLCSP